MRTLSGRLPILGVCLGHQAICEAFGATVTYARTLMHGKASWIRVAAEGSALFAGIEDSATVGRYHSLAVDPATLPDCLRVTALSDDGEVMAVEHVFHPTYGLQFHPESILTPCGERLIRNFLGAMDA